MRGSLLHASYEIIPILKLASLSSLASLISKQPTRLYMAPYIPHTITPKNMAILITPVSHLTWVVESPKIRDA